MYRNDERRRLERRLLEARRERDLWKGRSKGAYEMAVKLVAALEKRLSDLDRSSHFDGYAVGG